MVAKRTMSVSMKLKRLRGQPSLVVSQVPFYKSLIQCQCDEGPEGPLQRQSHPKYYKGWARGKMHEDARPPSLFLFLCLVMFSMTIYVYTP